jgi:phenylalanyl-tRNA synthetase alpha chain
MNDMGLKEQLQAWASEITAAPLNSAEEVEQFRIEWLGRKGRMKDVMAAFKEAPNEEKRELGKLINEFKQSIEARVASGAASGADIPDQKRPIMIGRVRREAFLLAHIIPSV